MRTETRVINGVSVQVAIPEGNDSWKGSIVSVPELRSIPRSMCADLDTYSVDGVGIYTFHATSLAAESNAVLVPFDAPDSIGRWQIQDAYGAGGGGSSSLPDPLNKSGQALFSDGSVYVLRSLKASDIKPDFAATFSCSVSTVEIGTTVVTPGLSMTYNEVPLAARYQDSDNNSWSDLNPPTTTYTASPYTFTKTTQASVSFILEVTAPDATVITRGTGINWRPRRHWGTSVGFDQTTILALSGSDLQSGKGVSFTVNATGGNRITYAFITGSGVPVFSVGGFVGGFHQVATNQPITNSLGATANYDIWQSDNIDLGSTTVVVS